jgi:FkbM family methyltransferase
MEKHIDILQIGAHIGNSTNDPIYNKDLNNKSIILIEPVPFLFDILVHNYRIKCKKENIDIICLNVAVSDMDGTIDMYTPSKKCDFSNLPYWISQMGSMTDEHFHNHNLFERFPEFKIEKISVKCLTLNTIIKENNITSIDTLIVDTEGHDYTILKALDLSLLKPKNIVFEHKYMDGTYKRGDKFIDLTNHFFNNGYKFIKEDDEDIYLSLDTN